MSKFIAEKSFWDIFPQAEIGIVVINGMDNSEAKYAEHPEIESNLKEANKEVNKFFTSDQLSQCSVVSVWRDAFQKFKKKKGNRASIEALLSRVIKGNAVGTINPLVDIYNSVSLTYGLPVGGENLDSFAGNLRLTISEEGGDEFLALGDEENNPTLPGELCYLDDIGAVCRCWNWRDGQRTMSERLEDIMENRVAMIAIVVEDDEEAVELNSILHQYSQYIIGRMGIPHRERKISLISIAIDGPADAISALAGKLGSLPGVSAKTVYAKLEEQ